MSLGRMCGSGYFKCFAPHPLLTGGYTTSSDIHHGNDNGGQGGEKPSNSGVMYSTMLNINRILNGDHMADSTWDDAEVRKLNPNNVPVMRGKIQVLCENGMYKVPVVPG